MVYSFTNFCATNDVGGVTVKKTESALVIGIYGEGVTPGECNVVRNSYLYIQSL